MRQSASSRVLRFPACLVLAAWLGNAPAIAQNRGVSAQAATDAAAAQVPRQAPATDVVRQDDVVPAIPQPAPVAPSLHAPLLRGVLFKVVPPVPASVPAESLAGDVAPSPVPAPAASYLLGTIHFGTPEEQGIDYAALERLLGETETFVNEADLDAPWQSAYDGYRWLPVEQPLSAMVGTPEFERARALLPTVRTQDLERMKPWAVLALLEARGESGGDATMDARLQRMASAADKRLMHLETLEQQLQALDCVPAQEHAPVLVDRLRASWVLRVESAQAMAYYRARTLEPWLADIDRMEGLGEQARSVEQRARRCLLEDRNARWLGQLQSLFQDGPSFVAVGAVHLVGPEGLLAALRRDGYRVEAMPL